MIRRSLSDKERETTRMSQNLLAAVKTRIPGHKAKEWMNRSVRLSTDEMAGPHDLIVDHVMFLLGRKIPRLVRADRVDDAIELLGQARGMLVGIGAFSLNDVYHASYE